MDKGLIECGNLHGIAVYSQKKEGYCVENLRPTVDALIGIWLKNKRLQGAVLAI
jgi:hypothetical protein